MKVKVDQKKCIGCGVCVDIAEKAFVLKDGISEPIATTDLRSTEILEAIKMTIEVCKVRAISLEK